MKVHGHKNHLILLNNDTELNEQNIKATSINKQKGMAFSERLLEASHKFTRGPFNFSPEASMFELWASIKQRAFFLSRNTSRNYSTLLQRKSN